MDSGTAQRSTTGPSRPFLPLFFSLAGWALLQTWIHLVGANHRAHILVAVLGLVLTLWSAVPFPGTQAVASLNKEFPLAETRPAAMPGALLFVLIGAVLGILTTKGSVFLLCAAAMALNFVPWARLPLGQRHPALPLAATLCGFGAATLAGYESIDMMFLPVACWAFWMSACLGLIRRAGHSLHAKRKAAAMGAEMKTDSGPAVCET